MRLAAQDLCLQATQLTPSCSMRLAAQDLLLQPPVDPQLSNARLMLTIFCCQPINFTLQISNLRLLLAIFLCQPINFTQHASNLRLLPTIFCSHRFDFCKMSPVGLNPLGEILNEFVIDFKVGNP